jgi:hypothetical protein
MRCVTDAIYQIPAERVVGSSNALRYVEDAHGGTVVYRAQPDVFDDGPAKPVRIWSRIGRRPLAAAGNSNGDIEMLQFAGGRSRHVPCRPEGAVPLGRDGPSRHGGCTPTADRSPGRRTCPRSDSNRHSDPFKGSASAVGLRGRTQSRWQALLSRPGGHAASQSERAAARGGPCRPAPRCLPSGVPADRRCAHS